MQTVFAAFFICVCNRMPCRNLWTVLLPRDSLPVLLWWFDVLSESLRLWNNLFESHSDFSTNIFDFRSNKIENQGIINLSSYCSSSKRFAFVILRDSKIDFLWEEDDVAFSWFRFVFTQRCQIRVVYLQIFLSSILEWIFRQCLQLFCFNLFPWIIYIYI